MKNKDEFYYIVVAYKNASPLSWDSCELSSASLGLNGEEYDGHEFNTLEEARGAKKRFFEAMEKRPDLFGYNRLAYQVRIFKEMYSREVR